MALYKNYLDANNTCCAYSGDNGDGGWIIVFDSCGYRTEYVDHWCDRVGGSEWSHGFFKTEEEAIQFAEGIQRC